MSLILVFTGKNWRQALEPIDAVTTDWRYYSPRYPQNLGFERALKTNAIKNGIDLSGKKLYFAIVEDNDQLAHPVSAKMMIPQMIVAVDKSVYDEVEEERVVKKRIEKVWNDYSKRWDEKATNYNGDLVISNDLGNQLTRERKSAEEDVWFQAYRDYFNKHDIWGVQARH